MIWQNFIDQTLQPVQVSNTISEIKSAFKACKFNHLPVFKKEVFKGSINIDDLIDLDPTTVLSEYKYLLEVFYVETHKTNLDLIHEFANHQTNLLPILDDTKKYVGVMKLEDVLDLFGESPFVANEGEVMVLRKERTKFAFSEVAQLIETLNARVSGMYVSQLSKETIEVTVKVEHQGINEILQTFRRYDYQIASEHPEDLFAEDLKEHSDYLNKYLDI
ncbi:CBS domain-containing protein [Psychroflexus montanilacus]|uniref:CBS domain-containing protein n=1 Tax=Psychroflexus montanilacus TaxID=2873598 RepID=UPI001CCD1794|nr:CBS domain-containing protein [Psychroflexus montanilacus]MBZ9652603.1 CBS domain-containing protein [Psychroflexus montanilacus]